MIESDLLSYAPATGHLALDIGANIGEWTRELARRFRHVHAYEPQPIVGDMPDNVNVRHVAVGETAGTATLRLYNNSAHATMVDRPDVGYGPQTGTLTVPQVALDELYTTGVQFIKIDVEGAETQVLRGATRLLSHAHPTLLIEVHSPQARIEIMDLLEGIPVYAATVIPNPLSDLYCWIHAQAN